MALRLPSAPRGFLLVQSALACQNREDKNSICFFGRIRLKASISLALYLVAAALPIWSPILSLAIFVLIPAAYFWPDPKSGAAGREIADRLTYGWVTLIMGRIRHPLYFRQP